MADSAAAIEDDLSLPRAAVNKMIKEMIPMIRVSNDARELVLNCCTEFIHLIASEANEICNKQTKKTISPEHVIQALQSLGFHDYVKDVEGVYQQFKKQAQTRKKNNKMKNQGVSEEELLRQQQALIAKARAEQAQEEWMHMQQLSASQMGGVQPTQLPGVQPDLQTGLQQPLVGSHSLQVPGMQSASLTSIQSVPITGLHSTSSEVQHYPIAGIETTTISGVQSTTMSGVQPARISVVQSSTISGVQSATISGVQPEKISGVQSTTISEVQLTTIPGVQPEKISGVQSTTISGVPPVTVAGMHEPPFTEGQATVSGVQPIPMTVIQSNPLTHVQLSPKDSQQPSTLNGNPNFQSPIIPQTVRLGPNSLINSVSSGVVEKTCTSNNMDSSLETKNISDISSNQTKENSGDESSVSMDITNDTTSNLENT